MSNATIARASVSRTISSTPLRILDAPDIVDDYYLNLISWGHNNVGEPLVLHGAVVLLLILGGGRLLLESVINRLCFSTRSDFVGGRNRKPLVKNLFKNIILWAVCVCVCVFFPSILDIKFVGRTSRGHTGGRSHRIFNPPSFCGACLDFCREKDSAIPFPRRP